MRDRKGGNIKRRRWARIGLSRGKIAYSEAFIDLPTARNKIGREK
jgi:hypothetical protein